MNLRNVLKAGEYAAVVPIGIPCAIEYDDRGILQHLYTSYDYRSDTVDDELKDLMYQKRKIPGKISITSGTSWVVGVIYTGRNFPREGNLPDCILDEAVKYVKLENSSFNFFGAYVKSQAMRFSGPMNINQWLTMNKFNVLPNFIVPVKPNDKLIQSILSSHNCPFKYEAICEYITISGEEVQHRPLGFYQIEVKSVSDFIDSWGYIKTHVVSTKGYELDVNISDTHHYDIHVGDFVIINNSKTIQQSFIGTRKRRTKLSDTYTCSKCGNLIKLPTTGGVMCSDEHCISRMYPEISHFVNRLGLAKLSYEEYKGIIDTNPDFKFSDILNLYPYSESVVVTTLYDVICAVVPTNIVSDYEVIREFVSKSNNNIDTVIYNILHPDRIMYNLTNPDGVNRIFDRPSLQVLRFVEWMRDSYNADTLISILKNSHIQIEKSKKKFDGAPIFRNKRILITGKFVNGSKDDIISILSSYSAEVVTTIDDSIDCVVTGGTSEDINGTYVIYARQNNIPVIDEIEFFHTYEIDKDMESNLL